MAESIHTMFSNLLHEVGVESKITGVVTDNASCMRKAFRRDESGGVSDQPLLQLQNIAANDEEDRDDEFVCVVIDWKSVNETYLPVHQMAKALGPSKCRTLPFIHSLSGRDMTSYPFFTGKKMWLNCSYTSDIPELERFGEEGQNNYQTTS